MSRLFVLFSIFIAFAHAQAQASYITYKGVEQLYGGECTINILQQYERYIEILLTITTPKGGMVQLEALTLETPQTPGKELEYNKSFNVENVMNLGVSQKFYREHQLIFLNHERTALNFYQWQLIQTISRDGATQNNKVDNYHCLKMQRI